jgi:hypothetical protein
MGLVSSLPVTDFVHVSLSRCEQCPGPGQHGDGFGGQRHGLGLDSPLGRLFMRLSMALVMRRALATALDGGVQPYPPIFCCPFRSCSSD